MSRRDGPPARRRLRRRRISAVLAGGLVLGVGSFATLAAWTDTENASASFTTSVFDTESQSAGSPTYASNTSAPGAALTFSASAMSPGVSYYAWWNVRTTSTTNVAGSVALTGVTATGALAPALQYRMVRMSAPSPTATCGSAAFTGSPVFVAGASGSYLAVTQVPASPVASPIAASGGQLGYCIEVRVATGSASSYQGQTATVTWTLTSTSAT